MSILVTGGSGFIGSNFIIDWLAVSDELVINIDKLTYAGNLENLASFQGDAPHIFLQGDLGDGALVSGLLTQHKPRAVAQFAAESQVDRSIHGPENFIQTNIVDTFRLLENVDALVMLADRGEPSEVYNISGQHIYSMSEIVEKIQKLCASDLRVEQDPALLHLKDEPVIWDDSIRLTEATGWKQEIPLEEALADMMDHCRRRCMRLQK